MHLMPISQAFLVRRAHPKIAPRARLSGAKTMSLPTPRRKKWT